MTMAKRLSILAIVVLYAAIPSHATPHFVGPGSCSSSNCHGNNKPLKSTNVLQNEYVTWTTHDRHSRAYLTLLNADSKQIAANLGIANAATDPLCLRCHTTYVTESTHSGEKLKLEDGVSCESCHGAASDWLKEHAITGTTHRDNVNRGMVELIDLGKRATLCLSCHYGTEEKSVNHDLYGAGHPRLTFELDTFGVLQPKHWVVDGDYETRKGPYIPLKVWLIGQLHHAESTLAALSSPTRSKDGLFPELSLFDCSSCHHSLTADQWKQGAQAGNAGQLRLNLPSLVLLKEATAALNKGVSEELATQLTILHNSYKKDGAPEAIKALQAIISTKVKPLLENASADLPTATRILERLSAYAAAEASPTFEVAEQLGMGMQATIASSQELAARYGGELKALFGTLKSSEAFEAARFTAVAKKLSNSVTHKGE